MAKAVYNIRAGLDASYADMEIAVQTKDGLGAKPLPIKVLLSYVLSLIGLLYVCSHTFISHGSVIQIGLFVIIWILLTIVLFSYDKTKRMHVELIPTLLNYMPKSNRNVITRNSANAMPFYQIANNDSIDDKTGIISFADGTFGLAYRVVGSASVLLFDDDRDAILDRVDAFYRKIGVDCELIFITMKESQKVYRQIAHLKKRYDNLNVDDEDLKALANAEFDQLVNYVGDGFKSIHQYLIIKGDNKEALYSNRNVVQSEDENSDLMIKRLVPMYGDGSNDVHEIFESVFKGD